MIVISECWGGITETQNSPTPQLIIKLEINDITYAINGAVFEVNNILGPGFLEKVYENALLVELKTVESLNRAHEAQLLNYLKATGLHVGLLVNFKHKKADIKRMVLNLPEGQEAMK